jgi:phosphoribosylamine-glycine ligase
MNRVLVTHAGGRLAIGVSRALHKSQDPMFVIAVDANPFQLQRAVADERHLVPRAGEGRYVDAIRTLVRDTTAEMIWPNHEAEIALLSGHKDSLEGALTFLPPTDVVEACQDKMRSFDLLDAAGLPVPRSMLIPDEASLRTAFERFGTPVWVRAISGAGGKGSRPVSDFDTAKMWIDLHNGWGGSFMAAECLTAQTITWESIWDNGDLVLAQGRKRLYWEFSSLTPSGVTGICGACVWVADGLVDDIGERAVKAIAGNPHGVFSVDITYDQDGGPRITEINCGRFMSGGMVHFPQCGFNVGEIVTRLAEGRPLGFETPVLNPCPEETVLVHGMDVEPVVTTMQEVRAYEAALEGRLTEAVR